MGKMEEGGCVDDAHLAFESGPVGIGVVDVGDDEGRLELPVVRKEIIADVDEGAFDVETAYIRSGCAVGDQLA